MNVPLLLGIILLPFIESVHLNLKGLWGISMCREKCVSLGLCKSVDYNPRTLQCQVLINFTYPGNQPNPVVTRHTLGRRKPLSLLLITRERKSGWICVYCLKEDEIVPVGHTWEEENNIYTCLATGSISTKTIMKIAIFSYMRYVTRDSDEYKFFGFSVDPVAKHFENTQLLSVRWLGFDCTTNTYLWLSQHNATLGTFELAEKIRLDKGYKFQIADDPDYLASDLSKGYIFIHTYSATVYRTSFPPGHCKLMQRGSRGIHLDAIHKRIYFTQLGTMRIFSTNYDAEDIIDFQSLEVISLVTTEDHIFLCDKTHQLVRYNMHPPLNRVEYKDTCYRLWWVSEHLIAFERAGDRSEMLNVISQNESQLLVNHIHLKTDAVFVVPVKNT